VATYNGTSGDDTYNGTANADQINGNDGNDTLHGAGNGDNINGGQGSDTLDGGDGNDRIITDGVDLLVDGGAGQDYVEFDGVVRGAAQVRGGDGTVDSIYFIATFDGTSGAASFTGFTGFESAEGYFYGTAGNDGLNLSGFAVGGTGFHRFEIYGGDGDDTISDSGGHNFIYGEDGNDTIAGNGGDDSIEGGEGNDVLTGGAGLDLLIGGNGNDHIEGGAGDDEIQGGTGDDVINGGAGWDTMSGGTGIDILIGGAGANFYSVGTLETVAGETYDGSGSDSDTLVGGSNVNFTGVTLIDIETLDLYNGNATMTAAQFEMFESVTATSITLTTGGSVSLSGAGNDIGTVYLSAAGNTLDLGGISDAPTIMGGAGNDTITGGDLVYGGGGDDTLIGGGVMRGGAGMDTLIGGIGSDQFVIDLASDLVTGESYDGGEANDSLRLNGASDFNLAGVSLTSIEELTQAHDYDVAMDVTLLDGLEYFDLFSITLATGGSATFEWGTTGSVGTINLNAAGNTLDLSATHGEFQYHTINGGAGNDTVLGSLFANVPVTINGGGGNDTLVGGLSDNETLDGGAGDDVLGSGGGLGTDTLRGGDGNDTLSGTSNDVLLGGAGNDTFVIDYDAITITELAGGGTDGVRTTLASYTLGANVENLTGVATAQSLTGNGLNNLIVAGGADDALNGAAGDDTLDGGAGADTMAGGAGNDVFLVGDAGDTVVEALNKGTDEVRTALASYTLGANVENLRGTAAAGQSLTGNGLANTITGAGGDDLLDGGAGADVLAGGLGNDAYVIDHAGDVASENAGGGTDEVRTALAGYTLAANVENLVGTSASGQSLTGNTQNNRLTGGAGDDRLDGGIGGDRLAGGAGDDTFVVDHAGDVIVEAAGKGTDKVETGLASYALGANVEQLAFTGAGGFTGTGNTLANLLAGGSGNDVLDGLAGDDRLRGGAGNDLLDGDSGIDTADYADAVSRVSVRLDRLSAQNTGGGGIDTLAGIENLTGSAFADLLVGDALANVLEGGDGDDALNGGAGDDTLLGGAGDDVYYVEAAGDTIVEAADAGWDVVRSQADIVLSDNLEELFVGGAGRDGTGNALANTLHGSASSNVLTGLGGDDVIRGDAGRDTIDGGAGADLIDGGAGKDTLTGGSERDVFQFRDGDFGTTRALADVITDFSHAAAEKIQLNLVDADTVAAGNQAFAWIGTGAFTGIAGQLHYAQAGGNTYVEGDTNGDGTADFVIMLTGTVNLVASDFVL
jgi:Ca2+-binding RTX toxin-like protein